MLFLFSSWCYTGPVALSVPSLVTTLFVVLAPLYIIFCVLI